MINSNQLTMLFALVVLVLGVIFQPLFRFTPRKRAVSTNEGYATHLPDDNPQFSSDKEWEYPYTQPDEEDSRLVEEIKGKFLGFITLIAGGLIRGILQLSFSTELMSVRHQLAIAIVVFAVWAIEIWWFKQKDHHHSWTNLSMTIWASLLFF